MKKASPFLRRSVRLSALALITLTGIGSTGLAQTELVERATLQASETASITASAAVGAAKSIENASIQDTYILGPGDAVRVELLDVPEYSGVFTIGPDGSLYLPRLRSVVVEGFTVENCATSSPSSSAPMCAPPGVRGAPRTARSAYTSAVKWPTWVLLPLRNPKRLGTGE